MHVCVYTLAHTCHSVCAVEIRGQSPVSALTFHPGLWQCLIGFFFFLALYISRAGRELPSVPQLCLPPPHRGSGTTVIWGTCAAFLWVLGTQVLTFAQQMLYPLTHLPIVSLPLLLSTIICSRSREAFYLVCWKFLNTGGFSGAGRQADYFN